jgi:hypothetical protein
VSNYQTVRKLFLSRVTFALSVAGVLTSVTLPLTAEANNQCSALFAPKSASEAALRVSYGLISPAIKSYTRLRESEARKRRTTDDELEKLFQFLEKPDSDPLPSEGNLRPPTDVNHVGRLLDLIEQPHVPAPRGGPVTGRISPTELSATDTRLERLISDLSEKGARENAAQSEVSRELRVQNQRPRAMTKEDRDLAQTAGGYAIIGGPQLPSTRRQRFNDLIDSSRRESEQAMRRAAEAADPVGTVYNRIASERKAAGPLTDAELKYVAKHPVEFAIVYAQLNGLIYYAGDAGANLSRHVPWIGFVDKNMFSVIVNVASVARANNVEPAKQVAAANLVLETLRVRFAPENAVAVIESLP